MLLEEGAAFRTGRHRGILLGDGTFSGRGDRSGDRLDTGSGEDVSGFGRSSLSGRLEGGGFGFDGLEGFGQRSDGLVFHASLDLDGLEFSGDIDDRSFDGLAEIVALGGQGQDGGLSGLGAFFDGHILLRVR